MKKKVVSLLLTMLLCLAFAVPVFAEETQYKTGEYVVYSGHTDFDYYYTYTVEKSDTNYKCFSVVENGQRVYAAVKESLYEYCRQVFNDQDVTLEGAVQSIAGDGAPVILATWTVTYDDNGTKVLTELGESLSPVLYKKGTTPNFKLFYDLFDDLTVSVADDGSYMTIDNNPLNLSHGSIIFAEAGINHVKLTNKTLGLPDWLYEEMANTRALDGRQKEVFDDVTVTWSYHPSQGLEVIYRTNH